MTRTARVVSVVRLAPATIDTEEVTILITSFGLGDLAELANVANAIFIDRFRAVAEELVVSVDIVQPQDTLSSVVALVVCICTVLVLSLAKQPSESRMTGAVHSLTICFHMNVEHVSVAFVGMIREVSTSSSTDRIIQTFKVALRHIRASDHGGQQKKQRYSHHRCLR
jgi:hypothetical protein